MNFQPTAIDGAFIIDLEPHSDERGFFARTFCEREFRAHGIDPKIAQCNLCHNRYAGTVRGMHYQVEPAAESKLIRCMRGAIHDVIVDLRPDSPTFLRQVAVELSADNHRALYVPPLCAHGYQTLLPDTDVFYQTGEFYSPENERGLRYDDSALRIEWPLPVSHLSDKDASWPRLVNESCSSAT